MEILLETKALKAAATCAAKKDIRYYLKGVLVQFTKKGYAVMVGTDGSTLFAGKSTCDGHDGSEFELIIPLDTVNSALKGCGTLVNLVDFKQLGNQLFEPVAGKYPDWRRVVPAKVDGVAAYFDPELYLKVQKAVRTYHGKSSVTFRCDHNGNGASVITGDDTGCLGIIMPQRPKFEPFSGIGF